MPRILPALAASATLLASPLSAQQESDPPICMPYAVMATFLVERFNESRAITGLERRGALMEFWGNEFSGSWTLIVIGPSGDACVVATGGAFTLDTPAPPGVDG